MPYKMTTQQQTPSRLIAIPQSKMIRALRPMLLPKIKHLKSKSSKRRRQLTLTMGQLLPQQRQRLLMPMTQPQLTQRNVQMALAQPQLTQSRLLMKAALQLTLLKSSSKPPHRRSRARAQKNSSPLTCSSHQTLRIQILPLKLMMPQMRLSLIPLAHQRMPQRLQETQRLQITQRLLQKRSKIQQLQMEMKMRQVLQIRQLWKRQQMPSQRQMQRQIKLKKIQPQMRAAAAVTTIQRHLMNRASVKQHKIRRRRHRRRQQRKRSKKKRLRCLSQSLSPR